MGIKTQISQLIYGITAVAVAIAMSACGDTTAATGGDEATNWRAELAAPGPAQETLIAQLDDRALAPAELHLVLDAERHARQRKSAP